MCGWRRERTPIHSRSIGYDRCRRQRLTDFALACSWPGCDAWTRLKKRIVDVIRSQSDPARHSVGITSNVRDRLEWHGPSGHTLSHRPWTIVVLMEFPTEREAVRFAKYLKSGSGRAFTKRHFGAV